MIAFRIRNDDIRTLTQAMELQFPDHAPLTRRPERSCIMEFDTSPLEGPFHTGFYNLALRYTRD